MIPGPTILIVNADDFGMSTAVNQAISYCFDRKLISSATLLANFDRFEEACEMAHSQGLIDQLGIHINLTEGRPVCSRLLNNDHLCDEHGNFRRHRPTFLTAADLTHISMEVAAQIEACRRKGIQLTHADSHQHVHNEPLVFFAVIRVLQNSGIPFLRITRNLFRTGTVSTKKRFCKSLFNWAIGRSGLRGTDYLGSVDDFADKRQSSGLGSSSYEILTHPMMNEAGLLVDHVDQCPLENKLIEVSNRLSICSYRDLKKQPRLRRAYRQSRRGLERIHGQMSSEDAVSPPLRLTGSR